MYFKLVIIIIGFLIGNMFSKGYPETSASIVDGIEQTVDTLASTISDVTKSVIVLEDINKT